MDVKNFQDTFETLKPSFISDFLICMTLTLQQSAFFFSMHFIFSSAFHTTVIDLLITTSLYN